MAHDDREIFLRSRSKRIEDYERYKDEFNKTLTQLTRLDYEYNFDYLGLPIIQMPQDIIAMQEIIWKVKPDLVIETGVARGGSIIFSASMLSLLEYCDAMDAGHLIDPNNVNRRVIGIDIDIRSHNRLAIESHPMSHRIDLIEGSSTDVRIIREVTEMAKKFKRVLVCLDSNHTHEHVFSELEAYAPLVSKGSYCVVFDTNINDMPDDLNADKLWSTKQNPKTAVHQYLKDNDAYVIDKEIHKKLLLSVAPDGYLKKIR
ncbi:MULTISPECIES: cephalosporin hydroxylase family protein [unclassified Roseobacter]|uniref:cephalosporin hydroxylase family protein n=1 Tax=unclassified Roseobacter TaxID=196798 RepID=UPI0030EF5CFF